MTALLKHVLWIGGASGSGKTTVASRIARRHGLRLYSADTQTWAHRDRALREGHVAALRWETMTPQERWETATPDDMLEMSLHRERGAMIVDDLRRLPAAPLIVAEGTTVAPELVTSGVADRSRAVWLIPTAELLHTRLETRDLPRGVRELYLLGASIIEREAREHDVPVLTVDGSRDIDQVVCDLEDRFSAALASGPHAGTLAERRGLLREANVAIAAQVRAYFARPWADGNADSVVREFVCECGAPSCDASVQLAVGAAWDGPVLATGH
jgi:hypothetical protein